jgi:hypothetical protein
LRAYIVNYLCWKLSFLGRYGRYICQQSHVSYSRLLIPRQTEASARDPDQP